MKVTLELIGPDLPVDHPLAPWKKGEHREFDSVTAEVLQRERVGQFKPVVEKAAPKGKKSADGEGD